jgi:hypothetical protein
MTTSQLPDINQLQQENARLAATLRNLELQLAALYTEREAPSGADLNTKYQLSLLKEEPSL